MKKLVFILFFIFFAVRPAEAKLLPRFQSGSSTSKKAVAYVGVYVKPKLRSDRRALIIYFSNVSTASNVSYSLTYLTNGKEEGVGGSIDVSGGDATTRELFFGTCSSVCTDHTNITNMRLEVTSELTSGRKTVKRFRIKV
jgi:hypothetical protein